MSVGTIFKELAPDIGKIADALANFFMTAALDAALRPRGPARRAS